MCVCVCARAGVCVCMCVLFCWCGWCIPLTMLGDVYKCYRLLMCVCEPVWPSGKALG